MKFCLALVVVLACLAQALSAGPRQPRTEAPSTAVPQGRASRVTPRTTPTGTPRATPRGTKPQFAETTTAHGQRHSNEVTGTPDQALSGGPRFEGTTGLPSSDVTGNEFFETTVAGGRGPRRQLTGRTRQSVTGRPRRTVSGRPSRPVTDNFSPTENDFVISTAGSGGSQTPDFSETTGFEFQTTVDGSTGAPTETPDFLTTIGGQTNDELFTTVDDLLTTPGKNPFDSEKIRKLFREFLKNFLRRRIQQSASVTFSAGK